MNTPIPNLTKLWAEHQARAFPRGNPESDYGDQDFMDFVELDTFLAGYISQIANGQPLSNADAMRLKKMTSELEATAHSIQGITADYFHSLLSVAKVAVQDARRTGD